MFHLSSVREEGCATMIIKLTVLILLCAPALIQTADVPQPISWTSVELGGNVTFVCNVSEANIKFLHWYKQSLGHLVQTVASVIINQVTLSNKFKDSRFSVIKGASQYYFTIRNVSKEDEATYFCHTGTEYTSRFSSGKFLFVNDHNHQKPVCVKQSPQKTSVPLGDSVTFNCSLLFKNEENGVLCPDEHRVYWFRAGAERFDPNIIYAHRNSRNKDVKRSCVYRLSKTLQNSSDAGIYYCAVVTCGEILFGEGTQVETRSEMGPVVLVLGVLLACCVAVIALFLLFYIRQRNTAENGKGEMQSSSHVGYDISTVDQANVLSLTYSSVDFSARSVKRGKKRRESPEDCVYAAVRA